MNNNPVDDGAEIAVSAPQGAEVRGGVRRGSTTRCGDHSAGEAGEVHTWRSPSGYAVCAPGDD